MGVVLNIIAVFKLEDLRLVINLISGFWRSDFVIIMLGEIYFEKCNRIKKLGGLKGMKVYYKLFWDYCGFLGILVLE